MKKLIYLLYVIFSCNLYSQTLSTEHNGDNSLNDTLVIKNISKDLYVCTCKPNTANPSGEGEIYYQGLFIEDSASNIADWHSCDERFLMQWDLSELPKGIKIIEAKMQMVCAAFNGDKQGQLVYECISEPWNEDIGYSQKPNTLTESRVLTGWPTKSSYHNVDISGFVKSWYTNKIPNYGLMGFSVNTETQNSAIFCSSKFHQEDARPKLIIIYSNE
jgi:hypothetical protein